jgi:hypothetical protein
MRLLLIFIAVFSFAFEMKKGDFVTADIYDKSQVEWAKLFRMADVGGIHDPNITPKMLKIGALTFGYDWMPAFYYYKDGSNNEFVKWLYKNRKTDTINPDGPFPHCNEMNYDWCEDYYYNFGDEKIIDKKVEWLIKNIKQKGFNGLFFDWASGIFILEKEYKKIYKNFKKLNPNKNYFNQVALFYKKLKRKGVIFITNQAFRKADKLLPYVTYDMTESYITTDKFIKGRIQIQGKGYVDKIPVTEYYPIDSKTLKATFYYMKMLEKYKQKYKNEGFKNFIYLNYIAPEYKKVYPNLDLYKEIKPKNAIYFSYAMAKLFDAIVYAEVDENRKLERDDIYFYNLGKVVDKSYKEIQNGVWIRKYQNGFVLVSKVNKNDKVIKINAKKEFYDIYNKKWIKNSVIKLDYQKDLWTKKQLPLGRVYIYKETR